ncbi:hypothetical protein COU38_02860 [Candidatus Micrarchaeota archaeon CG10_big_fil_rev_8_21_14_0_10_54_18]|nr:MAG: hypothetical protein AUJ15_01405 [Candidatus Micrarchaeota archaeon CG1_02_55_41]PIO03519.1 MAG: hypothetical protein COT57_00645 [Candidatus Micrarchaeota archaeon CG09_land_8_20_14_0_10_55_25]PJD01115.1 MAG: hypothetical protein COU38_02860 [Candidatus Micrarchaeota archaeon CG10_big_fil_rev_8_21_14_0_10_54_18]
MKEAKSLDAVNQYYASLKHPPLPTKEEQEIGKTMDVHRFVEAFHQAKRELKQPTNEEILAKLNETRKPGETAKWGEERLRKAMEECARRKTNKTAFQNEKTMRRKAIQFAKKADLNQLGEAALKARNKLVLHNRRLIPKIAEKYAAFAQKTDLIQEGEVGLITAAKHFDWTRGIRFNSYARYWISQAVQRFAVQQTGTGRIPFHVGQKIIKFHRRKNELTNELGREPSNQEVFNELGFGKNDVEAVNHALNFQGTTRLDKPIQDGEDATRVGILREGPEAQSVADSTERRTFSQEIREALLKAKNDRVISKEQLALLEEYYGISGEGEMGLRKLGKKHGKSGERVRQIIARAYERLRENPLFRELAD